MSAHYFALSRYQAMWLLVCFDLPVLTKPQRHEAARFRRDLLKDGFTMLQYSVYIRPCPTNEALHVHVARVQKQIPVEGMVSILRITDKQFSQTINLFGMKRKPPPAAPIQLEFF